MSVFADNELAVQENNENNNIGSSVPRKLSVGTLERELIVTIEPLGSGTINPSGGSYQAGYQVTLSAQPNPGWRFDHWSGDISNVSNKISIILDGDMNVTAHFKQFVLGDIVRINEDINVRNGPGLEYVFIKTEPKGMTGIIRDDTRIFVDGYSWLKVEFAVGVTGWVPQAWLEERIVEEYTLPVLISRL